MGDFGSGFQGAATLVAKLGKVDIAANAVAQFGKSSSGKNYFYVDMMTAFGKGIPLIPPLSLFGAGGGASYGMSYDFDNHTFPSNPGSGVGLGPGQTMTGMTYTVDESKGLGLNLKFLAATDPQVDKFNTLLTAAINFQKERGVDNITVNGEMAMMAAPKNNFIIDREAPIWGQVTVVMSPTDNTLEAKFVAEIKDGDLNGNAYGHMYFSNNDWFVKVGRHEQFTEGVKWDDGIPGPVNITYGDNLALKAYFQMGKGIDPMPDPPREVTNEIGLGNILERESNYGTGQGIAFGASLRAEAGFNAFAYGHIKVLAGFDFNLQKYKGLLCEGSGAIGIDGWYAGGQAYVYVDGSVGLKIRRREFDLASLSLVALAQIKTPNPTYGRGSGKVKYRFLGGLIKGSKNFNFEFGGECNIYRESGTSLLNNALITLINPQDNEMNVDVDVKPSVEFGYPLDKIISKEDISSDSDNTVEYEVKLTKLTFKGFDSNGEKYDIPFTQEWDDHRKKLIINPNQFLWPNDSFEIIAEAVAYEDNVAIHTEVDTSIFYTNEGFINGMPLTNIKAGFPIPGQYNYYLQEVTTGQDEDANYLDFEKYAPGTFANNTVYCFLKSDENTIHSYSQCTYNPSRNRLTFNMDRNLQLRKNYQLVFVSIKNIGLFYPSLELAKEKLANGEILLSYFFRTAPYHTFKETIAAIESHANDKFRNDLKLSVNLDEIDICFDQFEIYGGDGFDPLVDLRSNLEANQWYRDLIYPMIYAWPGRVSYLESPYLPTWLSYAVDEFTNDTIDIYNDFKVIRHPSAIEKNYHAEHINVPPNNSTIISGETPPLVNSFENSTASLNQTLDNKMYEFINTHYQDLRAGASRWNYKNIRYQQFLRSVYDWPPPDAPKDKPNLHFKIETIPGAINFSDIYYNWPVRLSKMFDTNIHMTAEYRLPNRESSSGPYEFKINNFIDCDHVPGDCINLGETNY